MKAMLNKQNKSEETTARKTVSKLINGNVTERRVTTATCHEADPSLV